MNYESIIEEFLSNFPEFQEKAMKESKWWNGETRLVHVFFGYVLIPFLKKELICKDNSLIIERIFQFLEKMALSSDEGVKEILGVTILESLGDDRTILEKARRKMGDNTIKISREIEKGLGRE
jgi:hypothetical protein